MTGDTRNRIDRPPWTRFEPPLSPEPGDVDRLVSRCLPGARVVRVSFIDRGVVNSNYRVELAGGPGDSGCPRIVRLRLSRSGEGPLREGAIGAMLAALPGCRVPQLLGSEAGGCPEAHRRSLFTWIDGRSLDELAPGGDRAQGNLAEAAGSLGRTLAALHAHRLSAFGRLRPDLGVGAPAAADWAGDLARRVSVRLDNPAHGLDERTGRAMRARFAALLARLAEGPPIRPALVHGDLSPGNIILGEAAPVAGPVGAPGGTSAARSGTPRLSGLVDWEMARAADPAHDLASLRFELAGRWPGFARVVEECYLAAAGSRDGAVPEGLEATGVVPGSAGGKAGAGRDISTAGGCPAWERRVALASVPMLLDARMVASLRGNHGEIQWVDARLDAALGGRPG